MFDTLFQGVVGFIVFAVLVLFSGWLLLVTVAFISSEIKMRIEQRRSERGQNKHKHAKRQYPRAVDAAMGFTLSTGIKPPPRATWQELRSPYAVTRPLSDYTDQTARVYGAVQTPEVPPIPKPSSQKKTVRPPLKPDTQKMTIALPPADLELWHRIDRLVQKLVMDMRDGLLVPRPLVNTPGLGAAISIVDSSGEDVVVGHVPFSGELQSLPGWTSQPAPGVSGRMELYVAVDHSRRFVWEVVSYYGMFDAHTHKITYHPWRTGSFKQQPSNHQRLPSGAWIGIVMVDVLDFVEKAIKGILQDITE